MRVPPLWCTATRISPAKARTIRSCSSKIASIGPSTLASATVSPFDRSDKAITAPGDRLDELRRSRMVAERLAQFRDRLGERVVGYVCARPDGIEQGLLGHELARVIQKVQQQVQKLRCERYWITGA